GVSSGCLCERPWSPRPARAGNQGQGRAGGGRRGRGGGLEGTPGLADGTGRDQVLAARARHPGNDVGRELQPRRAVRSVQQAGHGEPRMTIARRVRPALVVAAVAARLIAWGALPASGRPAGFKPALIASVACALFTALPL